MQFISTNLEWTEAMKIYSTDLVTKKLNYLVDDFSAFFIKVTSIKEHQVKIEMSYEKYRVQVFAKDFYSGALQAVNKLKRIILKLKKEQPNSNQLSINDFLDEPFKVILDKEKIFILEPMTIDSALVSFDSTDYNFYVFKDTDYENIVSILYRRHDSSVGVIRCK